MANWTTPEEIARKEEIKKRLMTYSFPLIAIIIGAIVTIALNGF